MATINKEQHLHVLSVALQNLNLVIDQVESMDHAMYDELLEHLDGAKTALQEAVTRHH